MVTRRNFLRTAALASAGVAMGNIDLSAGNQTEMKATGEKVNIAFVGIGNRGEQIVQDFTKTNMINVVALCDIDLGAKHTQKVLAQYPKAKQFQDFRKMFDTMSKEIDAVAIATPDFAHFPICMRALKEGIHVFVEKPMTRTFYEAELLIQAALKYPNVVTQVGNQGHSDANYFQFKAWVEAGIIKDIHTIHAHMNNPRRWHTWDSKIRKLPNAEPIPTTLDWDLWHCAVPYREYSKLYHYGEWRSWYGLGMGALGDWGAHIIDTAHEFLELGLPYEINPTRLDQHNDFFFPMASTVEFKFGPRKGMPPVDLTWFDGVDNLPPIPDGYGASQLASDIPASGAGEIKPSKLNPGKIIYGKDLIFKGGSHGSTLSIIPEAKAKEMASILPEVPKSPSNHFANFLLACQGKEKTRSPFEIHGPLSQVFSLGVLAQRMNKKLYFDPVTKQITNDKFANALLVDTPPRQGWDDYYKI